MSLVEQLKELKALHAQGTLDDEEFESAKEILLGIRSSAPESAPGEDLTAMTVAQLKALCRERGIQLKSRARKADIIAALSAEPADTTAAATPTVQAPMITGSLEDAIAAAAPGDTLHIPAGTLPCRLLIDKDLTLIGHDTTLTPLTAAAELEWFAAEAEASRAAFDEERAARHARDQAA